MPRDEDEVEDEVHALGEQTGGACSAQGHALCPGSTDRCPATGRARQGVGRPSPASPPFPSAEVGREVFDVDMDNFWIACKMLLSWARSDPGA